MRSGLKVDSTNESLGVIDQNKVDFISHLFIIKFKRIQGLLRIRRHISRIENFIEKMGSGRYGNFISIAEPVKRYYRKIRIEITEKE